MAALSIPIEQFITLSETRLVIDVRSPSEFRHAHFPKACSLPLFSDEERKIVGTAYKQQSREQAIVLGVDFFGNKMGAMLREIVQLLEQQDSREVLVHCWRGGMRSAAVAWLLDLYGFKVYTLKGGYKRFRNWVLEQLERPYPLRVLSGYTGSGKTELLHELRRLHQPVLDLEGLAGHKGSAFGGIGLPPQPSTEQFENRLALKLYQLMRRTDKPEAIWVESESSRIGDINIHHLFFNRMQAAEHVHIEVPLLARLEKITEEYGTAEEQELAGAVERIRRRLGGLATQKALDFISKHDIKAAFEVLLKQYYDKLYEKSALFRPPSLNISLPGTDARENARIILEKIH